MHANPAAAMIQRLTQCSRVIARRVLPHIGTDSIDETGKHSRFGVQYAEESLDGA